MIRYSSPLVLNRLAWIFINIANRIIIMEFLGAIIAGTFAVAYKFPLLVSTVYGFLAFLGKKRLLALYTMEMLVNFTI